MSKFKLLAIRPLKDHSQKLLKNLNLDVIYKFYQDYDFILSEENLIHQIHYYQKVPEILFESNISVSAIVGKNGSGKSTIVELLSGFIFCLAVKLKLIILDDFIKEHELNNSDENRLELEIENFKGLDCELLYCVNDKIYSIIKRKDTFKQVIFSISEKDVNSQNKITFEIKEEITLNNVDKEIDKINIETLYHTFFYSILANYSLYGLNTNEIGVWLKSIFHKNDGYKTPIVLNPMRTEGVIDINRVTYLSKSRLLSNVFTKKTEGQYDDEGFRGLINGKLIQKLLLNIDFRKFNVLEGDSLKTGQIPDYLISIDEKSIYLEYTQKWKKKHLKLLIKSFYPKIDYSRLEVDINHDKIKKLTVEYILRKTEIIIKKYSQYKAYRNRIFRKNATDEIIEDGFNLLVEDFSHSTFKLRQALNFLIYNYYNISDSKQKTFLITTPIKDGISDYINLNIESNLKNEIAYVENDWHLNPSITDFDERIKNAHLKHSLTNYLPPSFFEIDFEFKDKGFFKDLSSGEKQMIYSINSIIYHLLNLNSIASVDSDDRVSYKNFNILLDEVELCFHPEFQRIYVSELIKAINSLNWSDAGYNIIFLTHSPFILSDIPSDNILKLNDGSIEPYDNEETYAANVHDLLANEFFLSNGFMGEYAKEKIKDLLKFLTYKDGEQSPEKEDKPKLLWDTESAEKFINMIGEPLLKFDLKELFLSNFYDEKKIDEEIKKLEDLKNKKKNDINK
ncbi:hypothetical protein [Cellulophaga sp. Hel_I_12]|uniref:hypothetical protein n=1 Tax=Cellulophaga sp. Hel_I_12 TaxID=1249972 RepID=UPI000647752B|nr:hypothetical protein [Cellulophaga sp. Hel_I_12]